MTDLKDSRGWMVQLSIVEFTKEIIAILLSTAGLIVGLFTLYRIQRVAKAQQEERRITQELLDVDQIEFDIKRVISKLKESNDPDSLELTNDLSQRLGAIRGTRRAMDQSTKVVRDSDAVTMESGFFCNNFVDQIIDETTSHIDVMTGSTRLISGFYTMDKVLHACERGVHVRIIGIDPLASDEILIDAARTVSPPAPTTADEYRELVLENHNTIKNAVAKWENNVARSRFEYRVHPGVPRVSFARSDEVICLGFLQFFRDAQPHNINDRHYIRIPQKSSLGQVINKHFEIGWEEAKQIIPQDEGMNSMPAQGGTDDVQ